MSSTKLQQWISRFETNFNIIATHLSIDYYRSDMEALRNPKISEDFVMFYNWIYLECKTLQKDLGVLKNIMVENTTQLGVLELEKAEDLKNMLFFLRTFFEKTYELSQKHGEVFRFEGIQINHVLCEVKECISVLDFLLQNKQH